LSARERRERRRQARAVRRSQRAERRNERKIERAEHRGERQTQRGGRKQERRTQRAEHKEQKRALQGTSQEERREGRQQRKQERRTRRSEHRGERQTQRGGRKQERRTRRATHRQERRVQRTQRAAFIFRSSIRVHLKLVTVPNILMAIMVNNFIAVFANAGIQVNIISTENLVGLPPQLNNIDVGNCKMGKATTDVRNLYTNRNNVQGNDITVYFVQSTIPPLNGCAAHPRGLPGAIVASGASPWTLAHEVGHVLNLNHVNDNDRLMTGNGTGNITNPPPDFVAREVRRMFRSRFSEDM